MKERRYRMKMKRLLKFLLPSVLVVGLVACSSDSSSSGSSSSSSSGNSSGSSSSSSSGSSDTTASSSDSFTVGVILKTLSSEYWGYVSSGAQDAADDYGVNLILQGPPSETNYSEQTSMIETMLSAGEADAIVISPLQADMVKTQVTGASIPVFFVDTDVDFDDKISFIGTGNEEAAYLGGEYMASLLEDGSKAVIIGGVAGNPSVESRVSGYKNALTDNNIEILDVQYAESNEEKAMNVMENFLQNFSQIDAVLVVNDSMAMAAQRAAVQAGRGDEIIFMGFDGISSGVEAVISGNITATTAQSPYQMGYQSVEAAVKYLTGEDVSNRIDTGARVIDASNAQEYLDELNEILGN